MVLVPFFCVLLYGSGGLQGVERTVARRGWPAGYVEALFAILAEFR